MIRDSGDLTAVRYRTTTVDGLTIFYRGRRPASPGSRPLQISSSSVMFRDLIPRLADRFLSSRRTTRVGTGDAPAPSAFHYTFDHLTEIVDRFLEQQRIPRYVFISKITAARSSSVWRSPIPSGCAP
jgi:hypothetical protein